MAARPGLTADIAKDMLIDRLRQIQDNRTFWADLLTPGILAFPAPYGPGYNFNGNAGGGSVALSPGSPLVAGTGTFWPTNDVVNTNLPAGVSEFGYVEVYPASMAGITTQSMLYVDAAGPNPEIVSVVQVGRTSFVAKFQYTHNPTCTVTQSSLANLQFRVGESYPVMTVGAVTSLATDGSGNGTIQLTLPWGALAYTGTYVIKLMYVTFGNGDLKALIAVKDEATGFPVRIHRSLREADHADPQRTIVTGNPWFSLVDLGASAQGNAMYEVWPAPSDQRQFSYWYWKQWPDFRDDTDPPPPFINPSLLFFGALADAKMYRMSKDDIGYDPEGARYFMARFEQGLQEAKNSDEAKVLSAIQDSWLHNGLIGNYDTLQLYDPSIAGFFAGGY